MGELELAQLVRARIQEHLPTSTQFDPFTIMAIVGLVMRVVQVCQWLAMLRQQAAIQRSPQGIAATKIRARLHDLYAKDHPEESDAKIDEHVTAAVKAFAAADREDLRQMKQSLDRVKKQPTEIKLFEVVDEMSKD